MASLSKSTSKVTLPAVWTADSPVAKAMAGFAALCKVMSTQQEADRADLLSYFHSVSEPGIPIADYVRNLQRCTNCGEDGVLIALVLIGRACAAEGHLTLLPSVLTAHRLMLTGLRVATKTHHDLFRSNNTFARAGGVTLQEMNILEIEFLKRLGFNAGVTPQELDGLVHNASMASTLNMPSDRVAHRMCLAMGIAPPLASPLARGLAPQRTTSKSSSNFLCVDATPSSGASSGSARVAARRLRGLSTSSSMSRTLNATLSATSSANPSPMQAPLTPAKSLAASGSCSFMLSPI